MPPLFVLLLLAISTITTVHPHGYACLAQGTTTNVTAGATITPPAYGNNMTRYYLVYSALNSTRISLTFNSFLTQKNVDFVTVYDGMGINPSALLCQFSGPKPTPFQVVSSSSSLFITWITDASVSSADNPVTYDVPTGWTASSSSAAITNSSSPPGVYFLTITPGGASSLQIEAPTNQTTGQYFSNMRVSYFIAAPIGNIAMFVVQSFRVQPGDYLQGELSAFCMYICVCVFVCLCVCVLSVCVSVCVVCFFNV